MTKGKLIVIDGIDGSGKATQVRLLAERLKKEKVKVKTTEFPNYEENFFGGLIGEYLAGAYGDFFFFFPRVGSVLYAEDRFESKERLHKWLSEGFTVLIDRYASANQIHQGGKIKDIKERKKFLSWLDEMEFSVFKIPKPDLVVYLDVPYEVSKSWLEKKILLKKKKYLKGRVDVAEENLTYLKNSRESALLLAKQNKNWSKVTCCKGMVCMSPEQVHEEVFATVNKRLKLVK